MAGVRAPAHGELLRHRSSRVRVLRPGCDAASRGRQDHSVGAYRRNAERRRGVRAGDEGGGRRLFGADQCRAEPWGLPDRVAADEEANLARDELRPESGRGSRDSLRILRQPAGEAPDTRRGQADRGRRRLCRGGFGKMPQADHRSRWRVCASQWDQSTILDPSVSARSPSVDGERTQLRLAVKSSNFRRLLSLATPSHGVQGGHRPWQASRLQYRDPPSSRRWAGTAPDRRLRRRIGARPWAAPAVARPSYGVGSADRTCYGSLLIDA